LSEKSGRCAEPAGGALAGKCEFAFGGRVDLGEFFVIGSAFREG